MKEFGISFGIRVSNHRLISPKGFQERILASIRRQPSLLPECHVGKVEGEVYHRNLSARLGFAAQAHRMYEFQICIT